MKFKVLNGLMMITSLFGYLEWGGNHQQFLFEAEKEILLKVFSNPTSVLHPFVLLPFIGQVILLTTLFQKVPSKILTISGILMLSSLLLFMLLIGIFSLNFKIIFSTIPFLVIAIYSFIQLRKLKQEKG